MQRCGKGVENALLKVFRVRFTILIDLPFWHHTVRTIRLAIAQIRKDICKRRQYTWLHACICQNIDRMAARTSELEVADLYRFPFNFDNDNLHFFKLIIVYYTSRLLAEINDIKVLETCEDMAISRLYRSIMIMRKYRIKYNYYFMTVKIIKIRRKHGIGHFLEEICVKKDTLI